MINEFFEWNDKKNAINIRKHGVGFEDATAVFNDPLHKIIPDPDHSEEEEHYIAIGQTPIGKLLVVVHVERGKRIRIFSARRAARREEKDYEENF